MKHLGLFEGIGGFSLAARWMGWETVAWCEINPFCQKVLKYHFPEADQLTDITKTDFTPYANRIDIITGGFPCQPYSIAGKRKGKEDERHLWPEMLRAIREVQPRYVVGENVRGLTNWNGGLVFDEVQADLEAEGYEVLPFLLPACAKDAPHERYRIWFIAHATGVSCGNDSRNEGHKTQTIQGKRFDELKPFTNTYSELLQGGGGKNGPEKAERYAGASLCRDTWKNFPTQSPVCGGDDGISDRVDRIKALGNAIVPQVAFEIFKAIEKYELTPFLIKEDKK